MEVTDEIKARIDIVDWVSRYTTLTPSGRLYKGLCPFHNERTPSFVVYPDEGYWHCFGACATGGDIFTFLRMKENLEFREALEILAKEAGVELHHPEDDPQRRRLERLYLANDAAAAYFEETLASHGGAAVARAYMDRRGIDAHTTKQFRLGYALDSWDALLTHLQQLGFTVDEILEAGLVKFHEARNRHYDAFRGRLMIPIRNRQGRVIGFGGRVLGDGQPKYLNTAETPLFHKSQAVYGIDLAYRAVSEQDQVVIVEGYMDVIAAHQYGYRNVVACMGTAVTADQLQQLERYTKNFVLALDADAAGQQATIRALNQARQALARTQKPRATSGGRFALVQQLDARLSILSMPVGKDPDDAIRQDPAGWPALVTQAQPLVDFYIRVVAEQVDLTTPEGKTAAVSEIAKLIAEIGNDIEREHYVQELSRITNVSVAAIQSRVNAETTALSYGVPATTRRRGETTPMPEPPQHRTVSTRMAVSYEDHLLANLLVAPQLFVWLMLTADQLSIAPINSADLRRIENQEILHALKHYITSDEPWDLEAFQEQLTEPLHGQLARLTAYGAQRPQLAEADLREDTIKLLLRVRINNVREQISGVGALLTDAQVSGDRVNVEHYKLLKNQIDRDLLHLQRTQSELADLLADRPSRRRGIKIL